MLSEIEFILYPVLILAAIGLAVLLSRPTKAQREYRREDPLARAIRRGGIFKETP